MRRVGISPSGVAPAFRAAGLNGRPERRHGIGVASGTLSHGRPSPMPSSLVALDAAYRQAERALRKPSSAIWLRSVCVRTERFDDALAFYVSALGLTLGGLDVHPMTAQPRARLLDAEGNQVFELVESDDAPRGVHELAFGMPRRTITLLRARLDLQDIAYTSFAGGLMLRDVDGTLLRIESL